MEFHEIAEVFPMLGDDELASLAEDIYNNKLRHKIVLFEGKILDGRNRFLACEKVKVLPETRQFNGDWDGAVAFVTSENLRRRHLSESQRALAAAELAGLAKGRPAKPVPENASREAFSQTRAADRMGVSRTSVQRARQVLDQGAPELVDAVKRGDVPVKTAEALSKLTKPEQQEAVSQGPAAVKKAAAALRRKLAEQPPKPPTPEQQAIRRRARVDDRIFGLAELINRAKETIERLMRDDPDVFKTEQEIFLLAATEFRNLADWLSTLAGGGGITDEALQRLIDGGQK